jgi:putative ABC transport system ATP-binding protein
MKKEPVVDVKNLNFAFGKGELRQQVLKNINLKIMPGEIVILTGPSGSGKTTLLTIIGALRVAEEGSVHILGENLIHSSEKTRINVRKQVGFIFQQHNLLKSLTAMQNVCMSLELLEGLTEASRQKEAIDILTAVGLKDRINYKPDKLSGGQRQRVSIARALAGQPKLILADEPTASLDKQSGYDAVHILRELAKNQGCAILLVTHDTRILDIADKTISLEDGKIIG